MNPFTTPLDIQRRGFERATTLLEKGRVAPDRAERLQTVEVGQTPSEVVYEENKLRLLHYEPRTDEQYDVPILVVYALINRPYVLDLQPDRSVVRTLLEEGFDVYMIDWGEPSKLDESLTLDDYVNRYVDNCVDVVRERSGQDAINVLGYCMGGTMSAMYAALHPEKVRNLALLAAGLVFEDSGGVLERWGDDDYYSPESVTEAFGNVPAEFLDVGFALMDPVDNFVTKYARLYDNLEDEEFVENFARMERWLGDGIDVAGDTYCEFLESIYQRNELVEGELVLGGERVDLSEIDMPVLQIVGEYDHLIPPEASKPFNDAVASDDTEILEFPTGHIGLSVSSKSHAELWPQVSEWFAERSIDEAEAGDVEATAEEPATAAVETEPADAGPEADASGTEAETEEEAPTDLEAVDGIGPAYAERLREFGVADLTALTDADAATLSEELDVGEERVADWIEQSKSLLQS